jgi:phosphoglycerate dehydrogenase-like enzyme
MEMTTERMVEMGGAARGGCPNPIKETCMNNKTSKRINKKEFGVIGLGRMGGDFAPQAIEKTWGVVGYYKPHADSRGQGAAVMLPSLRAQVPLPMQQPT